jgi:hypothetical protein
VVRRSGPRFVTCLLASLLIPHTPAAALIEVDVSLVLAGDTSNSMDPEEQALQREGFVAAFRSPVVHDAIRKGALYPSSCSGRRSWRIRREASMTVSYDFPGQTAVVDRRG